MLMNETYLKNDHQVGWLSRTAPFFLLSILLFLRFLLGWQPGDWLWIDPVYQVATYAIVAFWIVWKRDKLAQYHIDTLAVYLFVLFKPLQTLILPLLIAPQLSPMAFPQPGALACWVIAGALIFALRKDLHQLMRVRPSNWLWLLAGAAIGVVLAVLASIALIPWAPKQPALIVDYTLLLRFPYMLGYSGIDEEFVFRGLLWGALRRIGWREIWIWLFQAALFVLVHGYVWRFEPALPSLLTIFIGSLVYSALAWRSRSVTTPMLAHTFYNCFGFLSVIILHWLGL